MKLRVIKKYVIPIILIVMSIVIEMLLSNYKLIGLDKTKIGRTSIDYYIEDNNLIIDKIDSYIKKLEIHYETDEDAIVTLNYIYMNEFEKSNGGSCEIELYEPLNTYILNIGKNIQNIEISDTDNVKITEIYINNDYTFSFIRLFGISVLFLLLYYIFYNRKQICKRLDVLGLMIILGIGSIMIVSVPSLANMAPDEQIHVYNSYYNSSLSYSEFSKAFYFVSESPGHSLPLSIETNLDLNEHLNSKNMTEAEASPKSKFVTYDQAPYLIAGLGIKIADILNLPFTIGFYFGKFTNLIFYAMLSFFSIRKSTVGKKIIFAISILPTSIFLASHYSLDGVMISTLTFATVMFLNMYTNKNTKITKKDLALFIFPVILASFAKAIYAIMILLLLLLPKEKFSNVKQRRLFKTSIILILLLLSFTYVVPMMTGGIAGDSRGGDTSFIGQVTSIVTHPFGFIQMCVNNIYIGIYKYLFNPENYNFFGYLSAPDGTMRSLLFILLIYISLTSGHEFKIIKGKTRDSIIFIVLLISAMIYGAMYLTFTEVGNSLVAGVQSRYFLPILVLILISILPRNKYIANNENLEYSIISVFYILILFISVYSTMIVLYAI